MRKTKVYGTSDPALTYQVTSGSLINGDTLTGSLTRAAGENAGSYVCDPAGQRGGQRQLLCYLRGGEHWRSQPAPLGGTVAGASRA